MKVIITTLQPTDPTAICDELSDAGVHNVTVTPAANDRLEVACPDNELGHVVAALAHDGHIKAAVICARNISGRIHDLTLRSCV